MGKKDHVITQMLFRLADPVITELPKAVGSTEDQLCDLWQTSWDNVSAESNGDLVKLADATCEELKMLILVALMEDERQSSPMS